MCKSNIGCARVQAASAELRETAAEGLGELVDITSEETLKPFVVQITGLPLLPINMATHPALCMMALGTTFFCGITQIVPDLHFVLLFHQRLHPLLHRIMYDDKVRPGFTRAGGLLHMAAEHYNCSCSYKHHLFLHCTCSSPGYAFVCRSYDQNHW